MSQQSGMRASNLAQIVTIVGGFLVLGGLYADWFEAGGQGYSGTEDWTGIGALVVSIVVILAGLASMDTWVKERNARRFAALVATAAGIIALLLVGVGFTRAGDVVAGGDISRGLWISAIGALFAAGGGWMATQSIGGSSG